MDIKILDENKLNKWMSQFKEEDQPIVEELIADINYIDPIDYDLYTQNLTLKIEELSNNFENIYLIPINSLSNISEPKSDSALVFNIKKKYSQKNVIWKIDFEKIKRKSIIFFIDEFCGSGRTIKDNIENIDNAILKRIRSLHSYKEIKVYVLSIVMYKEARKLISSSFKFIDDICFEREGTYFQKEFIEKNFKKYSKKSNCKKNLFGYGNICSNIVFYNNCPNNTPSILWCHQGNNITPLFHNKKVNLTYKTSYYLKKKKFQKILKYIERTEDNLIIINKMKLFTKEKGFSLFIDSILYLCLRKDFKNDKFLFYTKYDENRFKEILKCCYEYDFLLNARKTSKFTNIGQNMVDILNNLYIAFYEKSTKINEPKINLNKANILYYPSQIKGKKLNK